MLVVLDYEHPPNMNRLAQSLITIALVIVTTALLLHACVSWDCKAEICHVLRIFLGILTMPMTIYCVPRICMSPFLYFTPYCNLPTI
ncbi:hypothetical protein F4677DRAFT_419529 [Hypoxylon crocopeplum]|nr:hypothetical protein F4677DRAFT_419529 [Hypoxylon crocopeplum]